VVMITMILKFQTFTTIFTFNETDLLKKKQRHLLKNQRLEEDKTHDRSSK